MKKKPRKNTNIQLVWGAALTLVGIGVFIRIPQVMPKLEEMEQFANVMWFVRFCLYLMGVILIGGGLKKLYHHFRPAEQARNDDDDVVDQIGDGEKG
jgi:Ni,Fe-hydrogenase I cytochrome b subunit